MTTHKPTRKEALAHLEENPRECVTWYKGKVLMSAIYWSGKRRIQRADAPVNIQPKREF